MDLNTSSATAMSTITFILALIFLLTSASAITIASHFKGEIITTVMSGKIIRYETGHMTRKKKNNMFNNAFVVTSHHKISRINKFLEQIQGVRPFAATLTNIAPNFNMFSQCNCQLDNVIFSQYIDQEVIAHNNKCLKTTLLKETSLTLQSLSKAIQASMMTLERKLGLKHLIKEGLRMISKQLKIIKIKPFEQYFLHAMLASF